MFYLPITKFILYRDSFFDEFNYPLSSHYLQIIVAVS